MTRIISKITSNVQEAGGTIRMLQFGMSHYAVGRLINNSQNVIRRLKQRSQETKLVQKRGK